MGPRIRFERVLAVMGAVALIVFATDALTFAATGSSLLLGRSNTAGATTTVTNTGNGPGLKVVTKSAATPPFAVNGKGKVINLYAARSGVADLATNAGKLGGKTLAEVNAASAPRVANVRWVAKSGGQFTTVKAALASITNNDATHRYLISVAPGTYVETGGIDLKPYVDIVGAGEDLTTISCSCTSLLNSSTDPAGAVMRGSGSLVATVADLTVANTGSTTHTGVLLTNVSTATLSLERVTVRVGAGAGSTTTVGVLNSGSSPAFRTVRVVANGTDPTGVWNVSSSAPTFDDVRIDVSGTTGATIGLQNEGTSSMVSHGMRIEAHGNNIVQGIANYLSTAKFFDTVVHATSGGSSMAVFNLQNDSSFTGGEFESSGAATIDGFLISAGSPVITGVSVNSFGGTASYGVRATTGTVTVRNSTVVGGTASIFSAGTQAFVSGSVLSSVTGGATFVCAFDVDAATGAPLNNACVLPA